MSSSRHATPLSWYSDSPLRKSVRVIVTSEKSIGSRCAVLSIVNDTSARPSAVRCGVPAKMTSSILPPRSVRGPWAPSTHATASTRFDLPEPFGPTTTVTPGSKSSTVLSAKDLKPFSVSDLRNTRGWLLSLVPDRSDAPRRRRGHGVRAGQAPRGPLGHVGISEPRSRVPPRAARRARPRSRRGHAADPARHHSTIASTAAGAPSNAAWTRPSGRLRTQPCTPRARASRAQPSRNHTPWTRPDTVTRRRMNASASVKPGRPGRRRWTDHPLARE